MTDDFKIASRVCAAVGACVALFATFLPWYSFEVVVPIGRVVQVFAVTSTLWAFTTLAPILIAAGAVVALVLIGVSENRLAGAVTVAIGAALLAYGIVRCFDVPHLGVAAITTTGVVATHAITNLEGGPFVELTGGILLATGGLGSLFWPSATAVADRPERSRQWSDPGTVAPAR